jgi:hypothetical protein
MQSAAALRFSYAAIEVTKSGGRAAVAAMLCALLAGQPVLAEAAEKKASPPVSVGQVQGQDRVLHALNRLTFGPRPGDVASVQAMGLDRWFEMQLNPGKIDDAALESRLAEYPALRMSLEALEKKYPGPQRLKALAEGRGDLPSDPLERAMVQDQVAFYKIGRARQEAAAAESQKAGADGMAGGAMAGGAMAGGMAGSAMDQKPLAASELAVDPMMGPAAGGPGAEGRGAAREALQKILSQAPEERMKSILALPPQQLVRLRGGLAPAEMQQLTAGMTPQQKEMLVALQGGVRMIALEAMESRVLSDVYSERQLEAVMTDFWLNHFNVYVRKNQNEPYLLPAYERETIRPRALGNFEDLLVATAKSPAMLEYLDNFRSVGPDSMQAMRIRTAQQRNPNAKQIQQASAGLNENYGRELMELHTLGVNGGYTQADVTQVAKVFTGWGIDRPFQGGEFKFEERRHEPGSKTVLGKTISENGEREGLEVLHLLATSPATAHFISQKLAVRFVSDQPPAALVDRMAASFLKSKGDIRTVLRTMFQSPEFWSTDAYRSKVKTPEEFVISAVRASGAQVNNPQALVQSLDKLGMPLYGMQTPNG